MGVTIVRKEFVRRQGSGRAVAAGGDGEPDAVPRDEVVVRPRIPGLNRPQNETESTGRVVFVDAIPRNAMGKVVKARLRELVPDR